MEKTKRKRLPLTAEHKAAIAAAQRRSWDKNREERMAAMHRPDVVAKMKRRNRRSLDIVHARNEERALKLPPLIPDAAREARIATKARLWQTNVTRTTEPPPVAEIHGLQKILCGRLV